MRTYEAAADSLEADVRSLKIFRRLAQDERAHIGSLARIMSWLGDQGYAEPIRSALAEEGITASCLETAE